LQDGAADRAGHVREEVRRDAAAAAELGLPSQTSTLAGSIPAGVGARNDSKHVDRRTPRAFREKFHVSRSESLACRRHGPFRKRGVASSEASLA
jgi:hypothetical protein